MLFTEKLSQLVVVTGLSVALMALAGCGGAGGDPNARSDEELWALADQAAAESGLANFQTINAGNADGIYDEVLGAVTDGYLVALSNAAPGAALSLPASAPRAAFETLS